MVRRIGVAVVTVVAAALVLVPQPLVGQRGSRFERERINGRDAVAREVLVRFRQPLRDTDILQLVSEDDAEELTPIGRAGVLRFRSRSKSAAALASKLSQRPDVAYAEPNYIVHIASEPDDPRFPELWALKNIGQLIGGWPGIPGADMRAVPAWDISVGSTATVVAVIDTGIEYTHADLAANMWSAPTAFTVNVGGAPLTCAAGTHGFNAIERTCDPMDDQGHGTHVAGTIGATGHNGTGVVGVNWTTRLMAIKFIDASGSGTTADAIAAVEFATAVKQQFASTGDANIRVLSNSWGGPEFSQALLDEVNLANVEDMLFVAGAGNDGFDNDILPFYPASFDAPNVVAVAATDNADDLAWFSNYGTSSVHLGAPGVDILSTAIGNDYEYLSGTSMATPHVSGAAALVLSRCAIGTAELKEILLATADPVPSLTGLTTSGGRLNVHSALSACIAPPQTPSGLTARGLDTKVVLQWSASPGATRYNVKRSLTPGGPYSSIAAAVHGTSYTDTAVVNGTTYYYVVSAGNSLGESGDSNEASATPNIPPDLVVSSFTAPAVSGADATIALSVTTRNQGAGLAAPSTTRFYVSLNSTLDASDSSLGGQAVAQLAPGAVSADSVQIVLPAINTGTYYLIATADADDVLSEDFEGNNSAARTIKIGPDLTVSALTVPSNGAAGATIAVSDTTKNLGGGRAATSMTRFYLSANSVLEAGDTLLAENRLVGALDPAAVSSGTTTVTIPPSTGPGTYYIVAKADADGAVVETAETNNTLSRVIVIGSDLVVSALTVPAKGAAGATIVVNDTTLNSGGGAAAASVTRFYLSSNSTLDAGDTLLAGSRSVPDLAGGAGSSGSSSVTLPSVAAATYYLIAKADDGNVVLESSETNNTLARTISVGGDLVVTAFTAPAVGGAGASLTVSDTTANQGGGMVGSTTTKVYLSANNTFDASDTLLGGRAVAALDAGANSTGSLVVTIPSSLAAGSYYLVARADADDVSPETQEANNTAARLVQIGSDLVVSALTVPTKSAPGATILVNDTILNSGGGVAAASETRFYLSSNSTLEAGDNLLAAVHAVPDLTPGAGHTGSSSIVLPAVAAGTYYLIAQADAGDVVFESRETNNTLARSIAIGGDLAVTSFTAPAVGGAGLSMTVSDTTANQGGGMVGPTTTKVYLSSNNLFESSDTLLAGRAVAALDAGAVSTGSLVVTIPPGIVAGPYYLIARADADAVSSETQESNNTAARLVQIGSDLTVSAVTAPARGAAGAPVVVSDTTTNAGGAAAPGSVTAFYLATSSTPGAGDVLLDGNRAVPPLGPGASSTGPTSVTIPAGTAAGNYYILAKADAGGQVSETAEGNNTRTRFISIGPDFAIASFTLSATSIVAGGALTATETTANQGADAAGPSTTRFYLSTNAVLDASDLALSDLSVTPLAAGASSTGSASVTIPASTAPGTYFLIAKADARDEVAESAETNNLSPVRTIFVTAAP